jgi:hypothetical protein
LFHSSVFSYSKELMYKTGIHLQSSKYQNENMVPYLHFMLRNGIHFLLDKSSQQTVDSEWSRKLCFESIQQLKEIHVCNTLSPIDPNAVYSHYERYPRQYEW